MKGIVLAGGSGTRFYPVTRSISKQLLPIYDKPMIYYPISVLMLAGIREILIISTPQDLPKFEEMLGNGEDFGVKFSFVEQPSPDGLAQAFILGEEFIGNDAVCLILGDNIFHGNGIVDLLKNARENVEIKKKATIFGYYVEDPERYGIADFDQELNVKSIEEKPSNPPNNYAIVGLYFFPSGVSEIAKNVKPSKRGELEITSVIDAYLQEESLKLELMGRGFAWLDTGTHQTLLEAGSYIEILERRQGLKVACLEEISYRQGFIDREKLMMQGNQMSKNGYGQYLLKLASKEKINRK